MINQVGAFMPEHDVITSDDGMLFMWRDHHCYMVMQEMESLTAREKILKWNGLLQKMYLIDIYVMLL